MKSGLTSVSQQLANLSFLAELPLTSLSVRDFFKDYKWKTLRLYPLQLAEQ